MKQGEYERRTRVFRFARRISATPSARTSADIEIAEWKLGSVARHGARWIYVLFITPATQRHAANARPRVERRAACTPPSIRRCDCICWYRGVYRATSCCLFAAPPANGTVTRRYINDSRTQRVARHRIRAARVDHALRGPSVNVTSCRADLSQGVGFHFCASV